MQCVFLFTMELVLTLNVSKTSVFGTDDIYEKVKVNKDYIV